VIVYFVNDEKNLTAKESSDENFENKLIHFQNY